ncbi:unnamed protein product, partial [Rotaria sp. Silwood1]
GFGNGSFETETRYSVGSYPEAIAVGDFNNDTRLDIVVANWFDSQMFLCHLQASYLHV